MAEEISTVGNKFLEGYRLVAKRVESPVCRTPLEDHCRLVAEWEPSQGCWVGTPSNKNLWSEDGKPGIEAAAQLAAAVSQFVPTTVCTDPRFWEHLRDILPDHIRVVELTTNDAWIHHTGPTFLRAKNGDTRGVQWGNCGSGGKHASRLLRWHEDGLFARKLLELERIYRYECIKVFIEAASFDSDGEGTILATEECMFHAGRKGGLDLDKSGFEHLLASYLAVHKIIWVPNGLHSDRYTNGHVAGLCRFIKPGVVVLSWCDSPEIQHNDPAVDHYIQSQAQMCRKALKRLTRERDACDRLLEIHKIPFPSQPLQIKEADLATDPIETHHVHQVGDLVPISYTTFVILNGGVILPAYGDPHDRTVLKVVRKLFPKRRVVQYYARTISAAGLSVRCILLPIPKSARYSKQDDPKKIIQVNKVQSGPESKPRRNSVDIGPVPEALPGTTISQYSAKLAHQKEMHKKVTVQRVRAQPVQQKESDVPLNSEDSSQEENSALSQIQLAQQQWLAVEGESATNVDNNASETKDNEPLPPPSTAFGDLEIPVFEDSDGNESDALPPPGTPPDGDYDSMDSTSSPNVAEDDAPLEDFGAGMEDEQQNIKFAMD